VMSYPALVYTFFDARSSEASVKYLSEFHVRGEKERVLVMCKLGYAVDFVIAVAAFVVILVTAGWASNYIAHRPKAVGLILIYGAAFLPRALGGTSRAVLATLSRFPMIAWLDSATTFFRVGLILALVLNGWQVAGVVWGNAIAMLVTGVLYGAVAYRLVKSTWGASWLQGKWYALKGKRRDIFGFLAYNDLNALLGMIPKQLDIVLLGYFRNPMEAGYYKLAKSIAGSLGYLVQPLQSVTYPEFSRLWGMGNKEVLRQKTRTLALHVGVVLGLAVVLGTALVPITVPPILGQSYRPAVLATQLLLLGSAIWLAFFWLRPVFMAQDRIRQWLSIRIAVVVLSFFAYPLVILQWGYIGLSACAAVMQLFGHSVGVLLLRHDTKKIWAVR
jgi:O-antigen/teichoic acid export membrane protein